MGAPRRAARDILEERWGSTGGGSRLFWERLERLVLAITQLLGSSTRTALTGTSLSPAVVS